jgi:hypothetical protein
MKTLGVCFLIAAALALVIAPAAIWGAAAQSWHFADGTTDSTYNFSNSYQNISIAPDAADIWLSFNPDGSAMKINGGDVMTWEDLQPGIVSVTIDRAATTAVDVYWW